MMRLSAVLVLGLLSLPACDSQSKQTNQCVAQCESVEAESADKCKGRADAEYCKEKAVKSSADCKTACAKAASPASSE